MNTQFQNYLLIFRKLIGTKASWLTLNRISHSFLAKGITILSLTAFAFSNIPWLDNALGTSGWRIKLLFVGSLVFVIGHFLAALKAPPEFNGRSEATHIVAEMLVLDTPYFFNGRRNMLKISLEELESNPPVDMPEGYLQLARQALCDTASNSPEARKEHSRDVYHAAIQLRQFEKPKTRLLAFGLMGLGAIGMFVPTVLNIFTTIAKFL
jgi:hypothetical protein